jgi:hypothetical protein
MRISRRAIENAFGSRRWFVAACALGVFAAGWLLWQGLQPCDDAYITFRHARNLAADFTPAWNVTGDPVMGSTTPAFVFLLGVPATLLGAGSIETIALLVNAALHALVVVLVFLVVRDLLDRPWVALLAAGLVAVNSVNVFIFSLGFENALLTATLLGCLYAARKGRPGIALVLASLAPLVRPEGLIATPLVWGQVIFSRRFRPRLIAAYLPIPLAWVVLATAYYGSPVPQPILAKKKFPAVYRPYRNEEVSLVSSLPEIPARAASLWSHKVKPLLLAAALDRGAGSLRQTATFWIALAGLPLLIIGLVRRRDGRLLYLLYPPLFLLLYAGVGRTEVWYWPSFVTFSVLILFSGCACTVLRALEKTRLSRFRLGEVAVAGLFGLFLAANDYHLNGDADPGKAAVYAGDPRGRSWRVWERERFETYREAAEYLNDKSGADPAGAAITSEVGVFGYHYRGPVIDSVGLCSPEALDFYPPPSWDIFADVEKKKPWTHANNFVPTAMVSRLEPRYVVNSLVYIANLLHRGSPVLNTYRPLHQLGRAWGNPVYILERCDPEKVIPPVISRAGAP